MSDRKASLLVEDKLEPAQKIETGIPQGSPISPLLFERVKALGGHIIAFVDDLTIYCHGKPAQTVPLLEKLLQECVDWAATRHTSIDLGPKLGFIHFTRSKMPTGRLRLRLPNGQYKEEDKVLKLLGIYLDSGLTFKEHINRTIKPVKPPTN
jgi:hypothetical protein